jgi:hypothetical protein
VPFTIFAERYCSDRSPRYVSCSPGVFPETVKKKWAVYTAVSGMLVLLSFYCMQRHRLFEIFRGGHTALQRAARENLHHGRLRMGRCIFRSPAHLRG